MGFQKGEKMTSKLDEFKKEMEPAKKIYTKELKNYARKFNFLGKMTLTEYPDIHTQDYVYSFEKLNGTSEDVLDKTLKELYDHMAEFSKLHGIDNFSRNASIWL